jgi:dipeptide/tripeptide permease
MAASDVADAVRNNIWSLVVVLAASILVRSLVRRRIGHESRTSTGGRIATVACGAVLVVELGFFLAARESFIALSHGIAAVTMVLGIIAVMLLNALTPRAGDTRGETFRRLYLAIAAALAASLAVTVTLHLWIPGFRHLVIVVELLVIVLFAAFWVVQTIEVWQREPEELREQLRQAVPHSTR